MNRGVYFLAQAYFHQDFQEFGEPVDVVENFCNRESVEVVRELRTGVATLIDSDATEDDLAQAWLDEGGAYYDPATDGITMRGWLRSIADVLDNRAAANAPLVDPSPVIPFKGISGV